jgi:Fe(3+) dicitrate transport protein
MWMALAAVAVMAQATDAGVEAPLAALQPRVNETLVSERPSDTRRIAGSAQVIGFEELQRQAQRDIHKVLESVPGVYVREEDGFGLRPNIGMRGVNADRSAKITLMEDGVLIAPAAYAAPQAYFFPAMARMTAVEVFKGPASIRFGPSSIGGAINLRSRDVPDGSLGLVDIAAGNFDTVRLHAVAGYGGEHLGALIDIVNESSQGFKRNDGGGSVGFSRFEGMGKLQWQFATSARVRHRLVGKFSFSAQDDQESYLGLTNEDFARDPYRRYAAAADDRFLGSRTHAQVTHELSIGDNVKIVSTVTRSDFARVWRRFSSFENGASDPFDAVALLPQNNPSAVALRGPPDVATPVTLLQIRNDFRFVSQSAQVQASFTKQIAGIRNELEGAVRFHHDEVIRSPALQSYQIDEALQPRYSGEPRAVQPIKGFARAFSLWLQDTVTYKNLSVTPGFRLERYDVFESIETLTKGSYTVPLFGLGVVYQLPFGFSALGGVYQGTSPVGPGQSTSIRPESAINNELGVRFLRRGLRAELIGFWSEYLNVTGECSTSTGCIGDALNQQFNGGRARTLGLEATLSYRRTLKWGIGLTMQGALTLTQSRFLSSFTSDNPIWQTVQANDDLPYVPSQQFNGRLGLQKGGFEVQLGLTHIGAMRELAGQGPLIAEFSVPARTLLNATMSFSPHERVTFYAAATNLLNRADLVSRRPFGARPQAPLLIQGGLRLTLF